ncbi:hypothetical protein BD289DRAFT_174859 [Coniella lustricola]|uniref:Uncharacterized protein n=1 Tax=Coniella lustricola TaxID=2025994 RepID=A0A2T3ADU3_9PEZI|nr:hypothetical protein BD289DRAFT_174859 [Coniella lustricola]
MRGHGSEACYLDARLAVKTVRLFGTGAWSSESAESMYRGHSLDTPEIGTRHPGACKTLEIPSYNHLKLLTMLYSLHLFISVLHYDRDAQRPSRHGSHTAVLVSKPYRSPSVWSASLHFRLRISVVKPRVFLLFFFLGKEADVFHNQPFTFASTSNTQDVTKIVAQNPQQMSRSRPLPSDVF